jgi:hypothetical protein
MAVKAGAKPRNVTLKAGNLLVLLSREEYNEKNSFWN